MKYKTKMRRALSLLCTAALAAALLVPASAAQGDRARLQPNTFDIGMGHVGVIDTDGALWMWGDNSCGQLGNDLEFNLMHPDSIAVMTKFLTYPSKILEDVDSISLGEEHTAAIKTDGSLWMWGSNEYGQLGNRYEKTCVTETSFNVCAVPVKIMDDVAYVSAGGNCTAAIKTDGSLWMWGDNTYGQLGNGGTGNGTNYYDDGSVIQTVPIKVMEDVAMVSVADTFAAAIKTDGSLWMWGSNDYGQLGTGSTKQALYPVKVMEDVVAVEVDGGYLWGTSAVIKGDGSLWLWGGNEGGRILPGGAELLLQPTYFMDQVSTIDADIYGIAAVKTDGSLWVWGLRRDGGRTAPEQVMQGVAAARVGVNCMGAMKQDGTLWMWGSNGNGQLGVGSPADDVTAFRVSEAAPRQVSGITGRLPRTEGAVFAPLDDGGQTEQGQTTPQPQTPTAPASFPDVKESDWFYPYVTELAGLGGISGFPDGTFRPGDDISRIEAYAIAVRLFPSDPGGGSAAAQEKAAQVARNNGGFWANDQITHALLNQISVFGMDAQAWSSTATREELSYLFYRAYDAWRTEQGLGSLPSYAEAAALIGDYAEKVALSDYEPCILWLYTNGIVKGVNADGDFNPKGTASRAECCTMLVSLCHPEDWTQTDWDGVVASLQQPASRLADGADFKGRARMHYDRDVAYYYCRALEEEIGIQIFYLPEWTPKADGLIQYDAFNAFTLDGHYFQLVLDELMKMKEAYDLYPKGFLKEMAQKKGSRAAEIILCPYTFEGVSSYGVHVYDYSDDAQKVDQIYYTGNGDSQYYSHEMGHMVMSSAAILNGWSKTCDTWESLSTSGMSYVSLYAMSSRAEDWAETWAYLWHQTDSVLMRCGDSGMKAKVQYLTQLLDQYTAVDVSQLPWASALD